MSELVYIKDWVVQGHSSPHTVKLRSDGRLSCDCRAWIYNVKKSGEFYLIDGKVWSSRDCSHLHEIPHKELLICIDEKDLEKIKER